ncbi:MAG: primosomal protein N' [Gammaproteobacteria bacterium]|nr:primosomal protein N' [Gammaproteobacteria bacterium]
MSLAIEVALLRGLPGTLDYAAGTLPIESLRVGLRVRVPLAQRHAVGVVVAEPRPDPGRHELRAIAGLLDETPLLTPGLLALCRWCAGYYHHPLGAVLATALPGPLRAPRPAPVPPPAYRLSAAGMRARAGLPPRASALTGLLDRLSAAPAARHALPRRLAAAWPRALARGWIEETSLRSSPSELKQARDGDFDVAFGPEPDLSEQQVRAWAALPADDGFSATLLDGVTGSGKTELYLRLCRRALEAGRQVLLLTPEIGLVPQLAVRCAERFGDAAVGCFHSGMGEIGRTRTWLAAARGLLPIIVGTRSAVFVPHARPGAVIVDEEHDTAYKQQDGLRYSGRDLAVVRARLDGVPVLLGSATPSLESLHNVDVGRYRHLRLDRRIGSSGPPPRIRVVDARHQPLEQGLTPALTQAIATHLAGGEQVLVFINRRGYAPALICHRCGWSASCPHCDARLTVHRGGRRLLCHHCGHAEAPPAACGECGGAELMPVGQGTERIEQTLALRFPGVRIERIDSDRAYSARRLAELFDAVARGEVQILVGTQMLAKGHDFAGLALAGLVSVDAALYNNDFRAPERLAQTLTQVAGRVGRRDRPGSVLLQTHEPNHPLLRKLLDGGYPEFARAELSLRRRYRLPPFASLALLRAEGRQLQRALDFLAAARAVFSGVETLGPVPAPMARRAGVHRAQLLLRAERRGRLQHRLNAAMPALRSLPSAGVRWSVDVDPYDLY